MNRYLVSDPSNQEHHVCDTWEDVLFEIPLDDMDDETPPTPDNPVQITDGDVLLTITALQ